MTLDSGGLVLGNKVSIGILTSHGWDMSALFFSRLCRLYGHMCHKDA